MGRPLSSPRDLIFFGAKSLCGLGLLDSSGEKFHHVFLKQHRNSVWAFVDECSQIYGPRCSSLQLNGSCEEKETTRDSGSLWVPAYYRLPIEST